MFNKNHVLVMLVVVYLTAPAPTMASTITIEIIIPENEFQYDEILEKPIVTFYRKSGDVLEEESVKWMKEISTNQLEISYQTNVNLYHLIGAILPDENISLVQPRWIQTINEIVENKNKKYIELGNDPKEYPDYYMKTKFKPKYMSIDKGDPIPEPSSFIIMLLLTGSLILRKRSHNLCVKTHRFPNT